MRVEKTPKAFAYRIYSHFIQQCVPKSRILATGRREKKPGLLKNYNYYTLFTESRNFYLHHVALTTYCEKLCQTSKGSFKNYVEK